MNNFYKKYKEYINRQFIGKYVRIHNAKYCVWGILLDAYDEFIVYITITGNTSTMEADYMVELNKAEKCQFNKLLSINNLHWNGKKLLYIILNKYEEDVYGLVIKTEISRFKELGVSTNTSPQQFNEGEWIHIVRSYDTYKGTYALIEAHGKVGIIKTNCFQTFL